jgi:hypothetical protein
MHLSRAMARHAQGSPANSCRLVYRLFLLKLCNIPIVVALIFQNPIFQCSLICWLLQFVCRKLVRNCRVLFACRIESVKYTIRGPWQWPERCWWLREHAELQIQITDLTWAIVTLRWPTHVFCFRMSAQDYCCMWEWQDAFIDLASARQQKQ